MLCAPSLSSPLTGAEQLRFRGRKKGHSLLGGAIVVQFGKFFPSKWAQAATATVDEEMTITYADLIHSTVALLHDSLLPNIPPQQIFQQLCHERARTLVVLRDIEEAQRDLAKSSQRLESLNNNSDTSQSQMMRSLRVGSIGKPWQKIVPSLSAGSDGNGLSGPASVSSPEEEAATESEHGANVGGSTSAAASDATQSPIDNRQWVSWATMNRRNKEEILNECGSICSDHPYSDICGDDDSSDDDESIPDKDDDADESSGGAQFARSLESYVKAVQHRKRERIVGVESRLVACATFYKDYRPSGAKVVVLSHIAVKKKFRRYGIGSFILKRIKSPSLVGPYDAVTLHVRSSEVPVQQHGDVSNANLNQCTTLNSHPATKNHSQHTCLAAHKQVAFFEKNAFTCDIILNSRFRDEEVNVKTGDVLLCYLPPFDNGHSPYQNHPTGNLNTMGPQQAVISIGTGTGQLNSQMHQQNSIKAMQEEAQRWREKSLEAYQVQMSYMARLQQEVMRLHEMLGKQEGTIEQLRRENSRLAGRLIKAERKTAKALIETLDKEAADFERMCSVRKISTGTAEGAPYAIMPTNATNAQSQHVLQMQQRQQQQTLHQMAAIASGGPGLTQ